MRRSVRSCGSRYGGFFEPADDERQQLFVGLADYFVRGNRHRTGRAANDDEGGARRRRIGAQFGEPGGGRGAHGLFRERFRVGDCFRVVVDRVAQHLDLGGIDLDHVVALAVVAVAQDAHFHFFRFCLVLSPGLAASTMPAAGFDYEAAFW